MIDIRIVGKLHYTSVVMSDDEAQQPEVAETNTEPEAPAPKTAAPKPAAKKQVKGSRCRWTDEDKAEIIRRYQAGEGPKAIGDSIGVSRNSIQQIIHAAGVTEGRSGENLRKKREEPQPEADENEPG